MLLDGLVKRTLESVESKLRLLSFYYPAMPCNLARFRGVTATKLGACDGIFLLLLHLSLHEVKRQREEGREETGLGWCAHPEASNRLEKNIKRWSTPISAGTIHPKFLVKHQTQQSWGTMADAPKTSGAPVTPMLPNASWWFCVLLMNHLDIFKLLNNKKQNMKPEIWIIFEKNWVIIS